jgi:hypothetical protein
MDGVYFKEIISLAWFTKNIFYGRPGAYSIHTYPIVAFFFVMALGGLLDDVLNSSLFPSLRIRAHRRLRSPATTTGWGCPCYPWTDPCMDSRVARSSSPEATNWDFLELWRPCSIRVEWELDALRQGAPWRTDLAFGGPRWQGRPRAAVCNERGLGGASVVVTRSVEGCIHRRGGRGKPRFFVGEVGLEVAG